MTENDLVGHMTVGVIGLGLTGRGIAANLLASGFRVTGYNRTPSRAEKSRDLINENIGKLTSHMPAFAKKAAGWQERYESTSSLEDLSGSAIVIETVSENLELKSEIYTRLEEIVDADTVIATNTSSLPISLLQRDRKHPERIIGMHWAEPADSTPFMEIIPGEATNSKSVELTRNIGIVCGKEPSVLNHDIRGFITNRLMYAMMREAFYLLESGVADIATIDNSFCNDVGYYATIAGPFRMMDLTGIPTYAAVMDGLFPELSCSTEVPKFMKELVESGAKGIENLKGFYNYTEESAREWEKAYYEYTYDARQLAEKYSKRVNLND